MIGLECVRSFHYFTANVKFLDSLGYLRILGSKVLINGLKAQVLVGRVSDTL